MLSILMLLCLLSSAHFVQGLTTKILVVQDITLCYIIKYSLYAVTVKLNYLLCL